MQNKKEIGKKIWKLFSKNYTYSQIAKELGVSKSVVSNVINYSLPADEWCSQNIKELKEKCEQDKAKLKINYQNELKKYKEKYKKEKKEMGLGFSIMNGSFITLISMFLIFVINTYNIHIPMFTSTITSKLKYVGTISAISAILGIIIFLISLFINNKIIKEYE